MKMNSFINPKSLSGTGFLSVLVTILIITPAIGMVWIWSQQRQRNSEIEKIRSRYLTLQEQILVNNLENITNFIDYKRSNTQKRVKKIIKNQVHNAYSLAAHIHGMQKDISPLEAIKFQIKETLRPIRWDNGTGYYFIFDYQGTEQLFADRPHMEGLNLIDVKDPDGKFLIRDMVNLVVENDSGFYSYRWTKPGKKDAIYKKLAYVKNFIPTGWVIGAGYYLEDMEEAIKKEVLQRIGGVKEHDNHFTFVIKDSGFCLYHPDEKFNRKNILKQTETGGRLIVQEMINTVVADGAGSFEYQWTKPGTDIPVNTLGHAVYLKEWNWIIANGVFLDDMQQIVAVEKALLKREQRKNITLILCIAAVAIGISLIFGLIITRRMHTGITEFTEFFEKAADSHIRVDQNKMIFHEFRQLGRLANQMVDDRMAREQETLNLQNLLKNITDSMPSMLIAVDKEMRVIQWNKAAEELTGIPAGNAEHRPLSEVFPMSPKEITIVRHALKKGEAHIGLRDEIPLDGWQKQEQMTVYPLVSEQINGAVIQIDDVTEKKKMEEMMIQSEKMLSVGGLAAGMAHEINNPLSGIKNNAQVLRNRLFKDMPINREVAEKCGIQFGQIRQYGEKRNLNNVFEHINQGVSRAARIVNDMLSFSRMARSEHEYCDLCRVMDKTIELASTSFDMKKKFDFKEIQITRNYDPQLPEVRCDRGKIQQVFLNLLLNGAHAMHETRETRAPNFQIQLTGSSEMVTIEIEDNGTGMGPEIKKRIFEPFFTTKDIGVGTGLGLSVSYFIIANHHKGEFKVESKIDAGTRFTIQLPVH